MSTNFNSGEQKLFSDNRITNKGNMHVFFIGGIGFFFCFLLLVGMVAFGAIDIHRFGFFMMNFFTNTMTYIGVVVIGVTGCAGAWFIQHKLVMPWLDRRKKEKVLFANENFLAYTGDIKISHHEEVRQNYNIKQIDGPAPVVPQIEGPKIRYARDLFETGKLFEAIRHNRLILGHGVREDGSLTVWGIPRKDYFSTIAGGLPSSGKTTTAFWILVQQILIGARIILVDPHMHYQSEDGSTSLTKELKPFQSSYIFPPIDTSSPGAILQRIKWMKQQVHERQRPGYVARLSDIVILVIDEFNSVCEIEEIRKILADDLSYIEREGRKFGLHLMLLGHRWSKDDIGKVNIRTVASTIMAHKQNDENQAAVLVGGKKHVQDVLNLTPGSYMFRSVNAMVNDDGEKEYRLTKVQTPMISAHDASWILALKQDVEEWLALSEPTSTPTSEPLRTDFDMPDFTESRSQSKSPEKPIEVESDPDLPPELLSMMQRVMEIEVNGGAKNQKELIGMVWGPEYTGGDRFYKAQNELMQIRKAIALQVARLRSTV